MEQDQVHQYNVVDLIYLDHQFIKECLEVFGNAGMSPRKLELASPFLSAVQKHFFAEKKSVYRALLDNDEFHFLILESQIEHDLIDQKIKELKQKVFRARIMGDELSAEFKVLSEILANHLKEEEEDFLPRLRREVDDDTLNELGSLFLDLRNLKPEGPYANSDNQSEWSV